MNLKNLDDTFTKWEMKMYLEEMEVGKERGQCRVKVGARKLESVVVVKYLGIRIKTCGLGIGLGNNRK